MTLNTPHRRTLARALLAVGGLALGLVLAEALARAVPPPVGGDFLLPIASLGVPEGLYRPHPWLRSEPTPDFEGVVRSVGHEVNVRINSLGCRGAEPAGDGARLMVVGDSFTIALQVQEDETFSARLSKLLGDEVLNCGVDGYSTWQALERYRLVDNEAQAEGVILVFFLGNDLSDNARAAAQQGSQTPPPPPPEAQHVGAVERWLITHSYLYGYGRLAMARAALRTTNAEERQRLADELGIFASSGGDRLQSAIEETRHAVRALRDEAQQRGDTLMVAVAPPVFAVDDDRTAPTLALVGLEGVDPDAPRRAMLELLREEAVPACDLSPPLRAAAIDGEHPYLLLDGHWSVSGHAVVAQELANCLANTESVEPG